MFVSKDIFEDDEKSDDDEDTRVRKHKGQRAVVMQGPPMGAKR